MNKRKFLSIKHQKYTLPDNKNFWNIVKDEEIFRLDDNKKMNCACTGHMEEKNNISN